MVNSDQKYTRVATFLHWLMAVAFVLMLGSGLSFDLIDMPKSFKFDLYQWHKSLGVLLLLLFFIRIAWRLFHAPPPYPSTLKKRDIIGAKIGHVGLYALMFAIPFSGWLMVSSSPYGLPTFIFGLFEWPHIPGVAGDKSVNHLAGDFHEYMAYGFIALIVIHITAVFKHALIDKIKLLSRISFFAIIVTILSIGTTHAKAYIIDHDKSAITFSGTHAGDIFEGQFNSWAASIDFDKDDLKNSAVSVAFETRSAKTGNAMYDGALPTKDWFNSADHPTATFISSAITTTNTGYRLTGDLTIRGESKPLSFDFILMQTADGTTNINTTFDVNRMDFNIGTASDPTAEWVGETITITINIAANSQRGKK